MSDGVAKLNELTDDMKAAKGHPGLPAPPGFLGMPVYDPLASPVALPKR